MDHKLTPPKRLLMTSSKVFGVPLVVELDDARNMSITSFGIP